MHKNPSVEANPSLVRFFKYLLFPVEPHRFVMRGITQYKESGEILTLPFAYYSPGLTVIYYIFSIAISIILPILYKPHLPITQDRFVTLLAILGIIPIGFLAILIFHHIVVSFLLAFFPWETMASKDKASYHKDHARHILRVRMMWPAIVYCYLVFKVWRIIP